MAQVTTLTFMRYQGVSAKLWAFGMMQFAHGPLSKVVGLQTYKLMGSGKAGFNPLPDWQVYACCKYGTVRPMPTLFFKRPS